MTELVAQEGKQTRDHTRLEAGLTRGVVGVAHSDISAQLVEATQQRTKVAEQQAKAMVEAAKATVAANLERDNDRQAEKNAAKRLAFQKEQKETQKKAEAPHRHDPRGRPGPQLNCAVLCAGLIGLSEQL